ncbi:MAG: hypothetical protein J0H84_01445 [Rhizobiales bacterium]|jgi:hypothetical protein|nr:hypothetical protein [Hyphomicrobiales bacterium]
MSLEAQRYEVRQIIAEGQAKGFPYLLTMIAVGLWFQRQGITPPNSLRDWLSSTARTCH